MMSKFAQEILAKGKPEWAQMVRQEGRQEGEQKGRQEGEQKGEQKGEARMLSRQLRHRFQDIPTWINEKITKADLPTLEEWGLRFVNAQSLEDVFGNPDDILQQ